MWESECFRPYVEGRWLPRGGGGEKEVKGKGGSCVCGKEGRIICERKERE